MDYLKEQETYKLPENSVYSENYPFRWQGGFKETLEFFGTISCFKSSYLYFKVYSFDENVMQSIEDWDLITLSNSIFFYYLESMIDFNQRVNLPFINKAVWKNITILILNPVISESTISFVKELDLKKVSTKEVVFGGVSDAMIDIIVFENNVCNPNALKNLLLFLDIDLISADLLVKNAFKDKSLKNIIDFLDTIETGNYER